MLISTFVGAGAVAGASGVLASTSCVFDDILKFSFSKRYCYFAGVHCTAVAIDRGHAGTFV